MGVLDHICDPDPITVLLHRAFNVHIGGLGARRSHPLGQRRGSRRKRQVAPKDQCPPFPLRHRLGLSKPLRNEPGSGTLQKLAPGSEVRAGAYVPIGGVFSHFKSSSPCPGKELRVFHARHCMPAALLKIDSGSSSSALVFPVAPLVPCGTPPLANSLTCEALAASAASCLAAACFAECSLN